jgi:hypothetical protein
MILVLSGKEDLELSLTNTGIGNPEDDTCAQWEGRLSLTYTGRGNPDDDTERETWTCHSVTGRASP